MVYRDRERMLETRRAWRDANPEKMRGYWKASNRKRRAARVSEREARDAAIPPDPITTLSSEERAYIAGLVDGDGCIRIGAVGTNRRHYYPIVTVGLTHRGVIEWLAARLSSGTVKTARYTRPSWNGKWKRQYSVFISGRRAQILCRAILPWLRVKREQAELVSDFPCCGGYNGPGVRLPDDVARKRGDLRVRMMALNRRGPPDGGDPQMPWWP